MPIVTASTSAKKNIKLVVAVSGISMSELEAQKFASSVQSNLCYTLGVSCEELEVEVSVEPEAETPEEEAPPEEEGDQELPEELAPEDITSMTPEKFKANKAKIMSKMGSK